MSFLKSKLGVLAVILGLSLLAQAQGMRLGAGVKINPGVRLVKMENRQAAPYFVQAQSGGPGSGTITYLTPAVVQAKSCQSSVSALTVSCTFNAAQTAGNVNAVVVTWEGTTQDISYLQDTGYNYYVRVFSATSRQGGISQNVYRTREIAAKAGNAVTVTFSAAVSVADVQLVEISNLDTVAGPYDSSVAASGTAASSSTVQTSAFITKTPTEFLLLGGGTSQSYATDQSSTGYSKQQITPYGDLLSYKVVTNAANQSQTGKAVVNASSWILQAVGFMAKSTTSAGTGAVAAFNQANTAGNLIVAVVDWQDGTHTLSGVADTALNTYTLAKYDTFTSGGVTLRQAIYYAKNIAGAASGNAVTATFSGDNLPSQPHIRVLEYGGLDKTAPLDKVTSKSGSSPAERTLVAVDAQSTATASELVLGAGVVTYGVDSVPATDPATTIRLLASDRGQLVADRILSSQASYDISAYLQASSQLWLMQAVYFIATGQTVEPPAPNLYSVTPASGPTSGGTPVTLGGRYFRAGARVTFGGLAATGVAVVDDATVTAVTPAHAAGKVDVQLMNGDGSQSTLSQGFQYDSAPQVSLAIAWAGSGLGSVSGSLNCHKPDLCQGSFDQGTVATLDATADAGYGFGGWTGPCTGRSRCIVSLNADTTVGANFSGYDSAFSASENPLSEAGNWLAMSAGAGIPGGTRVKSDGSHAHGTMAGTEGCSHPQGGVTQCTDSAALLAGAWSADQEAAGVVSITGTPSLELELLLRAHASGRTYEVYWKAQSTSGSYLTFARWNGDGTWTGLAGMAGDNCNNRNSAAWGISSGDTVRATVTGSNPSVLKAYVTHNGVETLKATCRDNDAAQIVDGAPGIGFYTYAGASPDDAGFDSFHADNLAAVPATRRLTVSKSLAAGGTVTSLAPHDEIQCGPTCASASYDYPVSTAVTLHAVAASGYRFDGWVSPCAGTADCTLTLSSDTTVAATFVSLTGVNEYYVDLSSGNDNNSGLSWAAPWRTLSKAATGQLGAGGTIVHIHGTGHNLTVNRSGNSATQRWIWKCEGCSLVGNSSTGWVAFHFTGNWQDFEGFNITSTSTTYADAYLFGVDGSHIRLRNNYVHDSTASCLSPMGGYGFGQQANLAYQTDWEISGNTIKNMFVNRGDVVMNNRTYVGTNNTCHAMYIRTDHTKIYNNVIYGNHHGRCMTLHAANGPNDVHGYYTVANNLCYDNGDPGLSGGGTMLLFFNEAPDGNQPAHHNTVINNIFYNNGGWVGLLVGEEIGCSELEFKNNIFIGNHPNEIRHSLNHSSTTSELCTPGGGYSGNITSGAPTFVNLAGGDFHSASASSLQVNKGTTPTDCAPSGDSPCAPTTDKDGITRPQGSASDIGPYEFPQ